MRDTLAHSPMEVVAKVGKILGEMIDASGKAKKLGWDSRYGHIWEDLRETKLHLYHLLLYGETIANGNKDVETYLKSGIFFADEITPAGVGFQDGQGW